MRLLNLIYGAFFATRAVSRLATQSQLLSERGPNLASGDSTKETRDVNYFGVDPGTKPNPDEDKDEVEVNKKWNKAMCNGQKIFMAMINSATQTPRFIAPAHSPWFGTLVNEFRVWGYKDVPESKYDYMCDFDEYHNLKKAFAALKINGKSKGGGGDNICYHVEHNDSPIVERPPGAEMPPKIRQTFIGPDGKRYRSTAAYATIGVNPKSGVLFFVNRKSPIQAAQDLWLDRPLDENFEYVNITPDQLPLLRATSDMAWGFWNRGSAQDITNINMIMIATIINEDTLAIINKALQKWVPPPGQKKNTEVPVWPGMTFNLNGDNEGMALLGSPNGVAAGYFLAQHKTQLGEKLISKITVFRAEEYGSLPNMILWVEDALESDDDEEKDDPENIDPDLEKVGVVVKRRKDGKDIVREHVFRVKI